MDNNKHCAPGAKALLAMKNLTKTVSIFKIPKPPAKRKDKIKILTEDHYIEELGKIIERDFFPDLKKLEAQNQYLDAVEKNDVIKLRELYAKYSGRKPARQSTGFESPATFETPINRPDSTPKPISTPSSIAPSVTPRSEVGSVNDEKCPSDKYTLDQFLSKFTSEDNNSFQEIIESADRKLRQKFAVLYDAEKTQAKEKALALTLPGIEDQFSAIEGPKTVDTWTYKNKNYIMYVPDGVDVTAEEKVEMAKQKQEINYGNTRLLRNPFDEHQNKESISEVARSHAKGLSGKIGVDGNVVSNSNEPNVRGFPFVRTPSPAPGITDSPLMTWGEIEGTPFRLDGSDTPIRPSAGPSFHIAETSRRENIALELAEKASERLRGQKAKAIEAARRNIASPNIRSTFDRIATMSPAAKRLATSRLGIHDSILTPSPIGRSKTSGFTTPKALVRRSTPSPLVTKRQKIMKTPEVVSTSSNNTINIDTTSASDIAATTSKIILTDDLLNIPTNSSRCKASDFF